MTQPPPGPYDPRSGFRPGPPLPPPGIRPLPPPGARPLLRARPMPPPAPMRPMGAPPMPPPGMPLPPPMAGPPPMYPQPMLYGPRYAEQRKKSNAGVIVAVALLGVVVVVGGLIAAVALSGPSRHVAEPGYSSYPTPTYTTPTYSTYQPTYTTPRSTYTTAPTSAYSTAASATQEPAGPRAVRKTKDNPLLTDSSTGLPNASCKLARWGNTPQASRAFFESARPCLDRVWQTALDDAGLPFEVPSLAFPTGTQWSSPCGNSSNGNVAAF